MNVICYEAQVLERQWLLREASKEELASAEENFKKTKDEAATAAMQRKITQMELEMKTLEYKKRMGHDPVFEVVMSSSRLNIGRYLLIFQLKF